MCGNIGRYDKAVMWISTEELFGHLEFFGTKRCTMGIVGVLFVRSTKTDVRAGNDKRRTRGAFGLVNGLVKFWNILAFDVLNVPAVAEEASGDLFCERQSGVSFDGDFVVEVNVDQIAKLIPFDLNMTLERALEEEKSLKQNIHILLPE